MDNLLSIPTVTLDPESFDLTQQPTWLRAYYRVEPWIALLLAVALIPVAAVLGIVIAILSRRSPLVRQRRLGWRGEELRLLKFRTMWRADAPPGPLFEIEDLPEVKHFVKTSADERIASAFAAWCRRYSLDEIPQLVHIIVGRMSFVGPRPITRAELETFYGDSVPEVLSLRPGLTGLWQVMGRNRLSYRQRRRLDLWLVRHASPRLFASILIRTVPRVLRGSGAW